MLSIETYAFVYYFDSFFTIRDELTRNLHTRIPIVMLADSACFVQDDYQFFKKFREKGSDPVNPLRPMYTTKSEMMLLDASKQQKI